MLAFAKDITKKNTIHPDESNSADLKAYMEYHRKLNHELLVYHSLDHAKTYLQKKLEEIGGDKKKANSYLEKAFPFSSQFAGADTVLLMLRKLINGHNSTNNWYRMNAYYFALVYDCMERFIKVYNRLLKDSPEKAREYTISAGTEVDFDDWVQLYFHELDFMIGKTPVYPHYVFSKRNKSIAKSIDKEMQNGKTREDALLALKDDFGIDPSSVKVILGKRIEEEAMELFYTSVENPIYEALYQSEEAGYAEGETLIEYSYFLSFHLKGLSEEEAESAVNSLMKTQSGNKAAAKN